MFEGPSKGSADPASEESVGERLRAARPAPHGLGRRAALSEVMQTVFEGESEAQSVGRFELRARVGKGGMGVVYRAWDARLERLVALKLVRWERGDARKDEMLAEARMLAKVEHPNVVSVFEVGELEGETYVAMEFIEGENLEAWLGRHGGAPPRQVLRVFIQAGRGLAAAHRAGVVHRDFKPGNVLVGEDGDELRARVVDFGLARAADDDPDGISGTWTYMSPEQRAGAAPSPASDQYSFCLSLARALLGWFPKNDEVAGPGDERDALLAARLPRRVRGALLRGLAVDPAARWPAMEDLLRSLEPRRRGPRAALALVPVALLTGLIVSGGEEPNDVQCLDSGSQFDHLVPGQLREGFLTKVGELDPESEPLIRARLEEQRQAWVDVAAHACKQTRVLGSASEGILDRKMQCLEHEAVLLATMLERSSDDSWNAYSFDGTTDITDCGRTDVANSPRFKADHPEDDPNELSEVRRRLREVHARNGVTEEAAASLELAHGLERDTRHVKTKHLRGEILLNLGKDCTRNTQFDEAVNHLDAAYQLARDGGDVAQAVHAASSLAYVYGYHLDDVSAGRTWARVAMAEVGRPGISVAVAVNAHLSAALLEDMAGDFDEGFSLRTQAEVLLDVHDVSRTDRLTLKVMSDLTASLEFQGRFEEAEATYKEILAIREQFYPRQSEETLTDLHNYGRMLYQVGRSAEAVELFEDVMGREDCETTPRQCAQTRLNLGLALGGVEDFGRAKEMLDESERITLDIDGPNHLSASLVWEAQGNLAADDGRLDDAAEYTRKSVELALSLKGRDDPDIGRRYQTWAFVLARQKQTELAQEKLELARAQLEKGYPPDHDVFHSLAITQASIWHHAGDDTAAIELLEEVERTVPNTIHAEVARGNRLEYIGERAE